MDKVIELSDGTKWHIPQSAIANFTRYVINEIIKEKEQGAPKTPAPNVQLEK